jgi:2'-hydroxyisoflavone reductase
VVIDTAQQVSWTREAVAALKGSAGRFMYVSSTGVFLPYRTVDIPEDGPIVLTDTPPRDPPSYGVMKALSENEARTGFGARALIIRPNYIVGPGDTTDRFTYWPVRVARGGEVPVPGRKTDFVQYIDVRDLAEWMVRLIEDAATGTFNAAGPAGKQTLEQFVAGLAPLAKTPLTYTWIEDYAWLRNYPLRTRSDGGSSGLTYSVPWVMAEGDELGHVQISNRKAVAAGLTFRPLLTTARDTIAWRESDAVPDALRKQPRYVLTPEQEQALLRAWKARVSK